ncbi:MAG: hypothetical protein K2X93_21750, partial [Candidatus Obscuribacterales bacterium]|nr:hypothetical protein [Candidatus Obscuribacterales bacterium]
MTYQFEGDRENQGQGASKEPLFSPAIGETPTDSYTFGDRLSFNRPDVEQTGAALRLGEGLWKPADQADDTAVPVVVDDKKGAGKKSEQVGTPSPVVDRAATVPAGFTPASQLWRHGRGESAEELPIPVLFKSGKPANDLEIVGAPDSTDTSAKKKTGEAKPVSPTDLSIIDNDKPVKKTGVEPGIQTEIPAAFQVDLTQKKTPDGQPALKKSAVVDHTGDVKLTATSVPAVTDALTTKAKAAPVVTDVPTATAAAPVVTDLLPT